MTTATQPAQHTRTVMIPAVAMLPGDLTVPAGATGLVIFAHGSGSSRLSERDQRVAAKLQAGGLATLLFDVLTHQEEALDAQTAQLRFDISLQAERLACVTDWARAQAATSMLRIGYFAVNSGAAAALVAAAARPEVVHAVVSRGGRADLAGPYLGRVYAPTLLIVGGDDLPLLAMNRAAIEQLGAATHELAVVPGLTHSLDDPAALDHVGDLALEWFSRHLGAQPAQANEDDFEIC